MKLAFVVQRYGREILGGSETLARQLAERLSRRHDITVLTTTATDYITWKNELEPGEVKSRGVTVRRFPVQGERDLEAFNKFSEEIYGGEATREQELEWLDRQGPVVPELVEYLKKEHHQFDLLVFFTYLYYPTFYGLQVAPEKSILVPTAHDEPPLKLQVFKEMFLLPSSLIFNTEAEEVLVLDRFPVHKRMRETIGMGMELLDQPESSQFRKDHEIPGKYLLYAGRIDGGKGMEELFRYFQFYKEENPTSGNLQLVLIGKLGMKLPENPSIRYLGFVSESEKLAAMAGATAVVQPSKMESLSIVTLESFSVGTPVIANGASRVLMDHCRKSNAGFYYRDFEEFEEILTLLLADKNLHRSLGKNGQRYIKEVYGWTKLLPKYELAFRSSARPERETRSSRPSRQERRDGDDRSNGRSGSKRGAKRDQSRSDVAEVAESDNVPSASSDQDEVAAGGGTTPATVATDVTTETRSTSTSEKHDDPVPRDTVETADPEPAPPAASFDSDDASSAGDPTPGADDFPEAEADPSAPSSRPPASSEDAEQEAVDESGLPSFYRKAIPPPPPPSAAEPVQEVSAPTAPPELPSSSGLVVKSFGTASAREKDAPVAKPGELPPFFQARPAEEDATEQAAQDGDDSPSPPQEDAEEPNARADGEDAESAPKGEPKPEPSSDAAESSVASASPDGDLEAPKNES